MTVWKRWSWRYRVLALLGLALLLQGSACPQAILGLPQYNVPGVGMVVAEKYSQVPMYEGSPVAGAPPQYYYEVALGNGAFESFYEGSPQYAASDAYFKSHPELPVAGFDRSAIPGGASTPAAPPAM